MYKQNVLENCQKKRKFLPHENLTHQNFNQRIFLLLQYFERWVTISRVKWKLRSYDEEGKHCLELWHNLSVFSIEIWNLQNISGLEMTFYFGVIVKDSNKHKHLSSKTIACTRCNILPEVTSLVCLSAYFDI